MNNRDKPTLRAEIEKTLCLIGFHKWTQFCDGYVGLINLSRSWKTRNCRGHGRKCARCGRIETMVDWWDGKIDGKWMKNEKTKFPLPKELV